MLTKIAIISIVVAAILASGTIAYVFYLKRKRWYYGMSNTLVLHPWIKWTVGLSMALIVGAAYILVLILIHSTNLGFYESSIISNENKIEKLKQENINLETELETLYKTIEEDTNESKKIQAVISFGEVLNNIDNNKKEIERLTREVEEYQESKEYAEWIVKIN